MLLSQCIADSARFQSLPYTAVKVGSATNHKMLNIPKSNNLSWWKTLNCAKFILFVKRYWSFALNLKFQKNPRYTNINRDKRWAPTPSIATPRYWHMFKNVTHHAVTRMQRISLSTIFPHFSVLKFAPIDATLRAGNGAQWRGGLGPPTIVNLKSFSHILWEQSGEIKFVCMFTFPKVEIS